MSDLIGLELELQVANLEGKLENKAGQIIKDDRNYQGNIIPELSKAIIEVISEPHKNLNQLSEYFKEQLELALTIADDNDLLLYPSTTIGPASKPESNFNPRYISKRLILGDRKRELEHHICGTHIHMDKLDSPDAIFKQYTVMTAMDPLFALMSASPFFKGNNSLKDYRVQIYRKDVFSEFPLQGQLLPYVNSLDEVMERQVETYTQWIDLCEKNGQSSDGYNLLNTCWGPLRFSNKTVEYRGADATLFSNVMALAATQKGIRNCLKLKNPEIKIGGDLLENSFTLNENSLQLPTFYMVKYLENEGIYNGMKNDHLRQYISNILNLAKQYIPEDEKHFMDPFFNAISERKTFSDEIINYALKENLEINNMLDENSSKEIRKYIANRFRDDLKYMG